MDNMNNYDNNLNIEVTPTEPEKKPRKNNLATLKVAAMIMAVVVVGGGAGFGGAYFAGRTLNNGYVDSGSESENMFNPATSGEERLTPTLNDLQNGVSVASGDAEFNSDGTYKYTRDLVSAVQNSIVYIEVYSNYYNKETLVGTASGIIISKDGYIVTNNHVVEDCEKYTVKVNSTDSMESKTYDATLCGTDGDTDLAVLKINGTNLPAAKLGDSDKLHLGDDVVIIGNPLGYETSVSKGVVSGLNRQVSDSVRGLSSIQTDAAINRGNSGGALFNAYGEVVGVVNEKRVDNYAESLGFAITINEAKGVIEDLISKGYVSGRSAIGIRYQNITEEIAQYRGLVAGWRVGEIDETLPVANSGLKVGDTIVEIDGKSTLTDEASEVLVQKNPGDSVELSVVRENSFGRQTKLKITVELGELKN